MLQLQPGLRSGLFAAVPTSRLAAVTIAAFVLTMAGWALMTPTAGAAVPPNPVPFTKSVPEEYTSAESNYWVYVPDSYDETHYTPMKLLVWMHGCGGDSQGDAWTVSPGGTQDWITVSVGGTDGGCWDLTGPEGSTDVPKVLNAVLDIETHFNIDQRRVTLGGYSSGGDLAYRTAFYNSELFAGVLAINTAPFRDTGSSQTDSLAAAKWKFNVVHVAHNQDTTYPLADVQPEIDAMTAAGFPADLVEVDGTHYDNPGAVVNSHAVPGTSADILTYLLPHLDDANWYSPEPSTEPDPDPTPDPDPSPDPKPGTPPRVTLKVKPAKTTRSKKATFRFAAASGAKFECRIDWKKFHKCTSPKKYKGLRKGRHTFRVKAIKDGKTGPVSRYSWKVSSP